MDEDAKRLLELKQKFVVEFAKSKRICEEMQRESAVVVDIDDEASASEPVIVL